MSPNDRFELKITANGFPLQAFFVILYKKYTSLKSRELEELSRFRVMSWQPFQLPWSASLCLFG